MFIPVVLDYENNGRKFILLKYLMFLDACSRYDWPLITHQCFEKYEEVFPNAGEYNPRSCEIQGYRLLDAEERGKISQFFVPDELYDRIEKEKGSKLAAILYLRESRWEPLESCLERYLREIMKAAEPAEGILIFADAPQSLLYLAQKYKLPVITYEMGPIRSTGYRVKTSYFCFDAFYTTKEIECRYKNFLTQKAPLLSRRALLALLLNDDSLNYLALEQEPAEYQIGVALGGSLVVPYFANNMYMDMELVNDVRAQYAYPEILFRRHPYDPYQSLYYISKNDQAPSPIPFLLKCARIAAVGSNTLFEAMLWGRTPCSKTEVTPMTYLCERDYCAEPMKEQVRDYLNFYVFCFLVPYEWRFDPEYIRWRCSAPSEQEIFKKHAQHFLSGLGLGMDLLKQDEDTQLREILHARRRDDLWEELYAEHQHNVDCTFSELRLNIRQEGECSYQRSLYCVNFVQNATMVSRFVLPQDIAIASVRFIAEPLITADTHILCMESDAAFGRNGGKALQKINHTFSRDKVIIADFTGATYLQVAWKPSGKKEGPDIRQLQEDSNRLKDLLNSKSWKVTRPLRAIMNLFRSIANRFKH